MAAIVERRISPVGRTEGVGSVRCRVASACGVSGYLTANLSTCHVPLDSCTGSGAIAVVAGATFPEATVAAADISAEALQVPSHLVPSIF